MVSFHVTHYKRWVLQIWSLLCYFNVFRQELKGCLTFTTRVKTSCQTAQSSWQQVSKVFTNCPWQQALWVSCKRSLHWWLCDQVCGASTMVRRAHLRSIHGPWSIVVSRVWFSTDSKPLQVIAQCWHSCKRYFNEATLTDAEEEFVFAAGGKDESAFIDMFGVRWDLIKVNTEKQKVEMTHCMQHWCVRHPEGLDVGSQTQPRHELGLRLVKL